VCLAQGAKALFFLVADTRLGQAFIAIVLLLRLHLDRKYNAFRP
jgi:hypothetical protein